MGYIIKEHRLTCPYCKLYTFDVKMIDKFFNKTGANQITIKCECDKTCIVRVSAKEFYFIKYQDNVKKLANERLRDWKLGAIPRESTLSKYQEYL